MKLGLAIDLLVLELLSLLLGLRLPMLVVFSRSQSSPFELLVEREGLRERTARQDCEELGGRS